MGERDEPQGDKNHTLISPISFITDLLRDLIKLSPTCRNYPRTRLAPKLRRDMVTHSLTAQALSVEETQVKLYHSPMRINFIVSPTSGTLQRQLSR